MLTIGCHLSSTKGFLHMGKEALSIQANTFQFFTRNPRGGKAKAIDPADVKALQALLQEHQFGPFIAHAPYTLNPCSATERVQEFAAMAIADDLARLELLPGNFYNFHPGSHGGQGVETGITMISSLLNKVLYPEMQTTVLLEAMAGKGSEIGSKFEELRAILDQVELRAKMGVCLDTCHIFDAGYDITYNLDKVLEDFDAIVGLHYLKALHINDSLNPIGSHKDRHACIGKGHIGLEAMIKIINHPALRGLPMVLETPNELAGYAAEIQLLRAECTQ